MLQIEDEALDGLVTSRVMRLFVIEGQALFGKALCQMFALDPMFQIVGDSCMIVASALKTAKPDVVLLDLDGLAGDVLDLVTQCREAVPDAKICVLSMRVEPGLVNRCLAASAEGFIMKDIMPADMLSAIKMISSGIPYVDPRAAGMLLRFRATSGRRRNLVELSNRELDIVKVIAEGLSNKEISARLSVSEKTVKNHVGRIFSKLDFTSRSQAAVYAIKNGLV